MGKKRRTILKAGAAVAAAALLPMKALARNPRRDGLSLDLPTHMLHESMIDFFEGKGFTLVDHQPLVTGNEGFNGGLRYDDTETETLRGQMAVQPCARIEDIENKDDRAVLPLFHIFYVRSSEGMTPADSLSMLLEYLVNDAGLARGRFAFVTTREFEGLLPVLEKHGFDPENQVHYRDTDEALAAGDGSGYFRYPGNPDATPFPTVGLYYKTRIDAAAPDTYPLPPGWTEIGEASIDDSVSLGFGLGTERVGYAQSGEIPGWRERLFLLYEQVDRHSPDNPPSGRELFSKG
ncbi:hypothetical protein [Hoeflea poritis]|uniref:Uncharacterized protein n=1 Tax=Hoeflea poritis TaxID=2993659 RepID=A0ABT4VIH5_9HYPH|nr:hypothetical protein [Hoeflea poritis]MDA4844514.1 hypothetical protein [Hoeflea poritis]